MEIIEITFGEFESRISTPYIIYSTASFNQLNKSKAQELAYLVFRNSKDRLGIIGGIKEGKFYSPFSAPFCGFIPIDPKAKISDIDESIAEFVMWIKKREINEIIITLPPPFYNEDFISKQQNAFHRTGFSIESIELNYSFLTSYLDSNYHNKIWRNARKNLNIAFSRELSFFKCETLPEKKLVYEVIELNRNEKGKPLHMSFDQITETSKIITADFFLARDKGLNAIASAIVFHTASGIVQVIYWGDHPGFTQNKTMNYLTFRLFEYYKNIGIQIVDTGYSTENSTPNYGLCEFKESIGCTATSKYSYSLKL